MFVFDVCCEIYSTPFEFRGQKDQISRNYQSEIKQNNQFA